MRRSNWRKWLDQKFGKHPATPIRHPKGLRLLTGPELLEDRSVPSVSPIGTDDHHGPAEEIGHYQPPSVFLAGTGTLLSGPQAGAPLQIATDFLRNNVARLGLTIGDLSSVRVTNQYTDQPSGTTHIYLVQQLNGLDIPYATANVSVTARGEVIAAGSSFVPGLATYAVATSPLLSSMQALRLAAPQLDLPGDGAITPAGSVSLTGPDQAHTLNAPTLSRDPIPARLTYTAVEGAVRLTWDLVLNVPNQDHWYSVQVDAVTGQILAASDWVDHATYNVYAPPTESPLYGNRTLVTDPWDLNYSPFGWHDTDGKAGAEFTDTRGNSVRAQEDTNADNNDAGAFRPDGGATLNFDFALNLAGAPNTYQAAAITNLFYVNNIAHDIHAAYGFTEVAGNFQQTNYSGQGKGGDWVWADAQDGSGTNNANFATPPDGQNPRMQQYVFTLTNPARDSDIDNGVIIHEYGHGVSNRLTGGPGNSNALNAIQSGGMGEGWSDFYALMILQTSASQPTAAAPMGNYVLGQAIGGPGIRNFPYSYTQSIDKHTFNDFGFGAGKSTEVHDSGELWATALWDLNHLLIQKHGYDANLSTGYNGSGTPAQRAGNKLLLQLVMDGMKLQPANPSFVQARNAILAADQALTGGANQYEIWLAFARRGLGTVASTAGSNATKVTTSFNAPPRITSLGTDITSVDEGGTITLSGNFIDQLPDFTLFADPNLTDAHTVTIDWGDGSTPDTVNIVAGQLTFSKTHSFADNAAGGGKTTITVTVSDPFNGISSPATTQVQVTNLPPAPVITGAPTNGPEAQGVTLGVTENDPGVNDTFTYAWTVLKNGAAYASGTGKNFTYTPDDNGTYKVSVTVTDDDAGIGNASPVTITADNVAPTATLGPVGVVKRLSPATFAFSNQNDAAADKAAGFTYFFDFNGDGDFTDKGDINGTALANAQFTFSKAGTQTITGRIRDKDGGFTNVTSTFTVERGGNQGIISTRHVLTGTDAGTAPRIIGYGIDGTQKFDIPVFSPSFTGGVRVATGDINGDGIEDLIAARGPGRSTDPGVMVFSGADGSLIRSLTPYSQTYTGGYYVASADMDGDDFDDVIVGPGAGSQAVLVYSGVTGAIIKQYRPTGFSSGMTVAAADVTGDGIKDIVVGAASKGTQYTVINGATGKATPTLSAFATGYKGGVYVAAGDVDGDGFADIIFGSGAQLGLDSRVRVVSGKTGKSIWDFTAYSNFAGGVRVSAKDLDGDGKADFLIAPGAGSSEVTAKLGPSVIGLKGNALTGLLALNPVTGFLGGIFVG